MYGSRVTVLPVDQHGLVGPADLANALADDTVLVSIMHGSVQPIRALADLTHARGVLFHTDASQTLGKIGVSVRELGVDLLTVTGHKMYAPKAIGALYVHTGLDLEPAVYGAGQERGVRSGTENVALIVALGQAARLALAETPVPHQLRDLLHQRLTESLPDRVHLNGHPTHRLPNTLNVSINGTSGRAVLAAAPDIAASTGSACHEGIDRPSPVLTAMGLSSDRARAVIRLSLGRWTTDHDITRAATALVTAAEISAGAAAGSDARR